jgi:hypothetical protein
MTHCKTQNIEVEEISTVRIPSYISMLIDDKDIDEGKSHNVC